VLLLQSVEHAAEVLADKVFEQLVRRVVGVDLVLVQQLVGQIGAGFEGEALRHHERVVAVEEDIFDLLESKSV